MRILVSGGAGFIGSHLCERLLAEGHEVSAVDNLSTGRAENVSHLQAQPRFALIRRDICEPFPECGPFGAVFNLASPASPRDYLAAPVETLMAGSLGTRNMLEVALRDSATFVQASTSETYGDPLVHPQPETYWGNVNPVGPRSVYDESKRFAEALAMAYHREHGVRTRIARLFNVYGPRMKRGDGRVIPSFLAQALGGRELTVFGDGSQTRTFCYVTDIVEGLVSLPRSLDPTPVNLGSRHEVAVLELARRVRRLVGGGGIRFGPLPEDDPKRRCPDTAKAERLLGWKPRVRLDEGLRRTLDWFRSSGRAAMGGPPPSGP